MTAAETERLKKQVMKEIPSLKMVTSAALARKDDKGDSYLKADT